MVSYSYTYWSNLKKQSGVKYQLLLIDPCDGIVLLTELGDNL